MCLGGHETKLMCLGRVMNVRTAGSKLVFLTISCGAEGDHQAMCNFKALAANGVTEAEFKQFKNTVRRGDWFSKCLSTILLLRSTNKLQRSWAIHRLITVSPESW